MRGDLAAYMVIHASILSPAPGRVCCGWPTGDKVRLEPKVLKGLDSFFTFFFCYLNWVLIQFNCSSVQPKIIKWLLYFPIQKKETLKDTKILTFLKCWNVIILWKIILLCMLNFWNNVQRSLIQDEYAKKNFSNFMYNSFTFFLKYMDMEITIQVKKKISPQKRITD